MTCTTRSGASSEGPPACAVTAASARPRAGAGTRSRAAWRPGRSAPARAGRQPPSGAPGRGAAPPAPPPDPPGPPPPGPPPPADKTHPPAARLGGGARAAARLHDETHRLDEDVERLARHELTDAAHDEDAGLEPQGAAGRLPLGFGNLAHAHAVADDPDPRLG